jgi:polysaccharide biosynthesis transport protein
MKPQNKERPSGGFSVHDALYIVFKHKWKILLLSTIGFAVAGVMAYRMMREPSYVSVAKLMVRYVVERATIDPEAGSQMMSGGMMTEMEILKSMDTAVEVASALGPEKLMPDAKTPPTAMDAGEIVASGLTVESPGPLSNMLYLTYRSSNSKLTTEVLTQIIQTYKKRHLEVHRNNEPFTQVSKQTDEARSNLRQTEEEINQLKQKSKVLTIEETMKEFEARRQATLQNQMDVESQLAEQAAKVAALQRSQATQPDRKMNEDQLAANVEPGAGNPPTADELAEERKRSLATDEYNELAAQLASFQQRRNELLINRKPSDPMLKSLEGQIDRVRKRGLDLVEQFPDLARKRAVNQAGRQNAPVMSLEEEKYLESGLKAKLDSIKAQSKNMEAEVTRISSLGFQLQDLERRRQLEEEKYRYFQSSLEKKLLDVKLDPNNMPNIAVLEKPTPPLKSIDSKAMKLILAIAFSGLGLGLALAFLIEMVIDRRVSRPIEISTRLQLPLMLSIPYIRSNDGMAKLVGDYPTLEPPPEGGELILPPVSRRNEMKSADQSGEHFIAPYVAAIHDRITFNFQVNNINHKPKLVALTGLSEGAGTSTLAAGLAKAFAENGERKVLLVDLNADSSGSKAHPADSLFKAVELSRSDRFRLTPRNLYFASASTRRDSKDSHALAPTALHEIMPHLVASDFDYIIFDMPPVGPTSPTLTMAGFMDKVLLVLDGDNTTREHLSWGYMELEKAKADVSCIFNKARSHAPRWVQGDL